MESGKIETITNEIGPKALDALVEWFTGEQDLDKGILQKLPSQVPPEHIGHQIKEIQAAQRKSAAKGLSVAPQTAYRLGMLAAYRRDYDDALNYFNEAAQADPYYSDAFEAIAWLQQSLAMDCMDKKDYDAAIERLAQARNAAEKSDPFDDRALALRGYIFKTLAQVSDKKGEIGEKEKYY
ncbi:MAG: tetratricopeptide repeat protein, partial [candidate division Zixibacteria bacterium]|nr:tetratricopeptide repeat protein [Phycisphaerae bacterium]NIU14129.1 tetratricopeptide repeat protein [candidate division Zixibacteria bacterium]NIW44941.1 tetratricopeptide repeat protein [Gammaproteobacteria bacterium]